MTHGIDYINGRREELLRAEIEGEGAPRLKFIDARLVGGREALLESLAEYPSWGLERLLALAEWRVRWGLDTPGLSDCNNNECAGCLNIMSRAEIKAAEAEADPEAAPRVRRSREKAALMLPAALGARGAGIEEFYHLSMIDGLDRRRPRRFLPLADMEIDDVARKVVAATDRFDLSAIAGNPAADWALSRRYGLTELEDRPEIPRELIEIGIDELAERVAGASRALAGVCAEIDRALYLRPRPQMSPREAWGRQKRAKAAAEAKPTGKAPNETARARQHAPSTPLDAAGIISGVEAALRKRM